MDAFAILSSVVGLALALRAGLYQLSGELTGVFGAPEGNAKKSN